MLNFLTYCMLFFQNLSRLSKTIFFKLQLSTVKHSRDTIKSNNKVRKLPPRFSGPCPSIFVLQHPIIIANSPAASAGGRRLSCVSRWRVCGVLSHFLPYRANANFSSVLKSRHLSTEINIATSPPPYRIVFHRSVVVRFGRCPGGFFFFGSIYPSIQSHRDLERHGNRRTIISNIPIRDVGTYTQMDGRG